MKDTMRFSKILLYQSAGFIAIMILCWADFLFDLQDLLFDDQAGFAQPIWSCLLQTLMVMLVWFLVSTSTRRVWNRLQRLEGFLRVCSWCRQIDYKGRWMPIEEFLNQSFDTPTTHGICEKCLQEQMTAVQSSRLGREAEARKPSH